MKIAYSKPSVCLSRNLVRGCTNEASREIPNISPFQRDDGGLPSRPARAERDTLPRPARARSHVYQIVSFGDAIVYRVLRCVRAGPVPTLAAEESR